MEQRKVGEVRFWGRRVGSVGVGGVESHAVVISGDDKLELVRL